MNGTWWAVRWAARHPVQQWQIISDDLRRLGRRHREEPVMYITPDELERAARAAREARAAAMPLEHNKHYVPWELLAEPVKQRWRDGQTAAFESVGLVVRQDAPLGLVAAAIEGQALSDPIGVLQDAGLGGVTGDPYSMTDIWPSDAEREALSPGVQRGEVCTHSKCGIGHPHRH